MKFIELPLQGAYLIEPDPSFDERGYFARTFCRDEFKAKGLVFEFIQMSTSFNEHKGQIRGMHFQKPPHLETKLVRCTKGALYDIIQDIREESKTFGKYAVIKLSQKNRRMLYIPKGFAHGFKTLEDSTEVFYMMDEIYDPGSAASTAENLESFFECRFKEYIFPTLKALV
jgi:dTDP-4-dehydrorhamnose 3,5-epimerase